eukprot:146822-Rhodomonas_salina.1
MARELAGHGGLGWHVRFGSREVWMMMARDHRLRSPPSCPHPAPRRREKLTRGGREGEREEEVREGERREP